MCLFAALAALGTAGAGATAAGATAAASTAAAGATMASTLATIGTAASVAGGLYSAVSSYKAGKQQEALLKQQGATERQLTAVKDDRTRRQYLSEIRQQSAELAARGIDLSSPTAVLLGQTAAQEMSFASQSIRSEGAAAQTELSFSQRLARARGTQGLLSGTLSAAGDLLKGAPELWPELRG